MTTDAHAATARSRLSRSPRCARSSPPCCLRDLYEEFIEVEDREFPHEQRIDRAGLRALASSRSSLAVMADAERERVLASLDRLWEQEPELVGRADALLPWQTRARRGRRLR